jgi:hypothetical protein
MAMAGLGEHGSRPPDELIAEKQGHVQGSRRVEDLRVRHDPEEPPKVKEERQTAPPGSPAGGATRRIVPLPVC